MSYLVIPPRPWARTASYAPGLSGLCGLVEDLQAKLADLKAQRAALKAPVAPRVPSQKEMSFKSGSPYKVVYPKLQADYQKALETYKANVSALDSAIIAVSAQVGTETARARQLAAEQAAAQAAQAEKSRADEAARAAAQREADGDTLLERLRKLSEAVKPYSMVQEPIAKPAPPTPAASPAPALAPVAPAQPLPQQTYMPPPQAMYTQQPAAPAPAGASAGVSKPLLIGGGIAAALITLVALR